MENFLYLLEPSSESCYLFPFLSFIALPLIVKKKLRSCRCDQSVFFLNPNIGILAFCSVGNFAIRP
jgi:hypothetical protein